ncbi:aminoglycoside phosphotransferase family protein [Ectobacillus ponti]|uniref:Aminoglycoside phosphotransferase family protein n=1 Tax=Ectobacillus ponti TaxID=2961894 RepID=A0AA42BMW5_9BACI|nr:aminoglycoside phosphotransferase family protein [Ectobacillus ponti]MCP8967300.1 aminoglycoside phosphotransferase family protein [Ectobacillus ponti]
MKKTRIDEYDKGDALADRLFFFLRQQGLPIEKVSRIRPAVFKVYSPDTAYIIKRYDYAKMEQQRSFLQALQRTGFRQTAYLQLFPGGGHSLPFAQSHWLLYEYLEHQEAFSFETAENRREALNLLDGYHQAARLLPASLRPYVPMLPWLEKWTARTERFRRCAPLISSHIGRERTEAFLDWADHSLRQLRLLPLHTELHSYLHGDLIEHNFIKGSSLSLIDFDCVSVGPVVYDYIKYSVCILPSLHWSHEELRTYMQPYWDSEAFWAGLLFPSDILREWDYFLSLPVPQQPVFRDRLVAFTLHQYDARAAFAAAVQEAASQ